MNRIDKVLAYLGEPYRITVIDHEPVIYRSFDHFEFEVSGLHKRVMDCTLYVWMTSPHRDLVGIYSNIRSTGDLKDLLGYCSVRYQNLFSRILVEREDRTE